MDSIIGLRYNGGVLLASDTNNARSILVYQHDIDKISQLTPHAMLGLSGPNCDLVNFSEFVEKNLTMYRLKNGDTLSTSGIANYCRSELATALRKGPFQVNTLLAGWDASSIKTVNGTTVDPTSPGVGSLYYIDYMGTMSPVNYGCQGYCSNFVLSVLDREWREGLTKEEALEIISHCEQVLKKRFLVDQGVFGVKKVDKEGVGVVRDTNGVLVA